ncbi:MAG TPA: FecR family protein [Ramlibacter sp.]|nr:FecR family protein [Ramlibacter sp.]
MNRSGSFAFALAALAVPAIVCAQSAASYAGGEVMFVSGKAQRTQKGGQAGPVAKGMTLLEGDRIKTEADSHVYVRLRDGGLLVVRPASELHVDLWRYDASKPQDSQIKYTLDSGVARHVSGQGAKAARDKFRFNTPMAAIGVRGTDFTVLADASVTRVSVQSGGVIVNGFGNGCRAEGLGPCEGASAVELFAGASNKLLQVRAGERRPELIDDPASAPDRARPAANGEPVAQRQLSAPDVHLADSRGSEVVDLDKPAPPPPLPDPPAAVWGRWAAIAANDTGTVKADDILAGRTLVAVNKFYILAANPEMTSFALPGDGVGNFALTAHDGVITDTSSGQTVPSTATNGKLSIDFGSRRFSTSLDVASGSWTTQVAAQGSVDPGGKFQSDLFVSPSVVTGIVGGKNASEAMYLYSRSFSDHYLATGATSWHK